MLSNKSDYKIEQFRLEEENFDTLAELITDAFLADETAIKEGASIAFTKQTFRTMYGAPTIDRDLFVQAIYKPTGKIVGFIGGIPRTLSIEGKKYKFAIPSWLSVHAQHQGNGIAKAMGIRLFEIGMQKGYDGAFSLHEPEQHGIDVSTAVSRDKKIRFQRVITLTKFVIKSFDVEKVSTVVKLRWYEKLVFKMYQKFKKIDLTNIRVCNKEDIPDMFVIIQEQVKRNQLSIVPTYEDFEWMLDNPNVICVVHEDKKGKVIGFMLAWEFMLAGLGNKIPFGWLDMVHIHRLNKNQGSNLANYLCQVSQQKGWFGLQTPYIPYFDMKPLKKANFFFFSKKINLDLFNLRNVRIPEKVESFYFDWR